MEPLKSWFCDTCGEAIPIADANSALVISRVNRDTLRTRDYRIVHKNIGGRTCDPGAAGGYTHSLELSTYLGPDGLAWALSELSVGPLIGESGDHGVDDMDQYVDFIRRVQTPWYEEARRRFSDADVRNTLGGSNEVYPYVPSTLERIAKGEVG